MENKQYICWESTEPIEQEKYYKTTTGFIRSLPKHLLQDLVEIFSDEDKLVFDDCFRTGQDDVVLPFGFLGSLSLPTGYLCFDVEKWYYRVSNLTGELFPFDGDLVIDMMDNEKRMANYGTVKKKEIKEIWDAARDKGTEMHAVIEDILIACKKANSLYPLATLMCSEEGEFQDALIFVYELLRKLQLEIPGLRIFELELKLRSDKHQIGGTMDALLRFGHILVILDWKRSKKMQKFEGTKEYLARYGSWCSSAYHMQLNVYAMLLRETFPGINIQKAILVYLHPNNTRMEEVTLAPEDKVLLAVNDAKKQIAKKREIK